eukprot:UC1_evm1s1383
MMGINAQMETESSVELADFLIPEKYRALALELASLEDRADSSSWWNNIMGPPNFRRYGRIVSIQGLNEAASAAAASAASTAADAADAEAAVTAASSAGGGGSDGSGDSSSGLSVGQSSTALPPTLAGIVAFFQSPQFFRYLRQLTELELETVT